jgi:hypothetical protein
VDVVADVEVLSTFVVGETAGKVLAVEDDTGREVFRVALDALPAEPASIRVDVVTPKVEPAPLPPVEPPARPALDSPPPPFDGERPDKPGDTGATTSVERVGPGERVGRLKGAGKD